MEEILFKKSIIRVNKFLKFAGISFIKTENSTFLKKLTKQWFFYMNFFVMNADLFAVFGIINELTLSEIFYMIPCVTMCYLADFKAYYFYKNHDQVLNLVATLKNLQKSHPTNPKAEEELLKRHKFLYFTNNLLFYTGMTGIATFFIAPIGFTISNYLKNKDIKLFLPFMVWYPYDAYDLKYWPHTFLIQFWSANYGFTFFNLMIFDRNNGKKIRKYFLFFFSITNLAWVAVFFVYGPDCFYYTCCVFIHTQFETLKMDVFNVDEYLGRNPTARIESIVHRHREIIRCIDMLQTIYGKSTLFNFISSSVLICLNGFNIMIIDDLMLMAPFTPFFIYGSIQIYLFCSYGDLIMKDSTEISEAMYNSKWYELDASSMKHCLFIIMRTQKPSKITAHGFSDINMRAFGRILSWAWSYFTLLRSIYVNKNRN